MAGATINGSTSNQYIDAKIVWSSTPNHQDNTSKVTAALYYKRNNTGYQTYGEGTFTITIDGTKTSVTKAVTITESAWVKAVEATKTISHKTDGSKSITISATGSMSGTSLSSTSCSGTAKLDTIPRATVINSVSCATNYFTGKMTYKYTPQSANYYNRCNISLNLDGEYIAVKSINLGQKSASQQTATVTLTSSELATIYNELTSAKQGTLRFTFRTYSDSAYSTQVGDVGYKEITLYIPNDATTKPSVSAILSPVSSLSGDFASLYIQGYSKVKASISATGKYKANIVSSKTTMVVEGKTYDSGDAFTSDYLRVSGSKSQVKITVTDSRGYSNSTTLSINVLAYSKPKLLPATGESSIICARCDANGNLTDSGTYLKIKAKRSFSRLSGQNDSTVRCRFKVTGSSSYSKWITLMDTGSTSDEIDTGALFTGEVSATNSHTVQINVVDSIGEQQTLEFDIPTERIYMDRAGSRRSLGIGKYAEEENTIDIAEDLTTIFRGNVKFAGEAWSSLGLSANVSESDSSCGRWGNTGCHYRVCAGGKHVYVAFNCAFTYSGSSIQINLDAMPSAYRPKRNVYAICATGGRAIARILVNNSGNIVVDWIQVITATEATTSSTVKWIDGYIDYWI